jgi:hypothetical protein
MLDGVLSSKKAPTRLSSFVLVPGTPRFKTKHSGVDDALDLSVPMDSDHSELIELGEATIKTLSHSGLSGLCPRVLFLCSPSQGKDEIDHRLEKAYAPHRLSTYVKEIQSDKQRPLDIHIAAHGSPEKIGSITMDGRHDAEEFAWLFDQWLEEHLGKEVKDKLKSTGFNKQPIHFTFHSCNSAWAPTVPVMTAAMIAACILKDSFIGRFKQTMTDQGYKNITVTGFRGFYTHTTSHRGSVVFGAPGDGPAFTADKTMFVITENNMVIIPSKPHFPVTFPGDSKPALLADGFRLFGSKPAEPAIRDEALAHEEEPKPCIAKV